LSMVFQGIARLPVEWLKTTAMGTVMDMDMDMDTRETHMPTHILGKRTKARERPREFLPCLHLKSNSQFWGCRI
jgi:hypothetical protein